jgi:hypothetical protein
MELCELSVGSLNVYSKLAISQLLNWVFRSNVKAIKNLAKI